jgi:hypothetical protein
LAVGVKTSIKGKPGDVQNSDSPVKIPIFCGLTSTDGFMLVGGEKVDEFDWSVLKGKEILDFRPDSTPLLFQSLGAGRPSWNAPSRLIMQVEGEFCSTISHGLLRHPSFKGARRLGYSAASQSIRSSSFC